MGFVIVAQERASVMARIQEPIVRPTSVLLLGVARKGVAQPNGLVVTYLYRQQPVFVNRGPLVRSVIQIRVTACLVVPMESALLLVRQITTANVTWVMTGMFVTATVP